MTAETADSKSIYAAMVSSNVALWLDYPASAHTAHEAAANAHDIEAGLSQTAFDRTRHKVAAIEHRKAAQYWAKKELESSSFKHPRTN